MEYNIRKTTKNDVEELSRLKQIMWMHRIKILEELTRNIGKQILLGYLFRILFLFFMCATLVIYVFKKPPQVR